jgi:hypothetical protein
MVTELHELTAHCSAKKYLSRVRPPIPADRVPVNLFTAKFRYLVATSGKIDSASDFCTPLLTSNYLYDLTKVCASCQQATSCGLLTNARQSAQCADALWYGSIQLVCYQVQLSANITCAEVHSTR